jgi:GTP cyclohydrolase II
MPPDLPPPHSAPTKTPSGPASADWAPDRDALRLRAVHRATAELRRGTPVLLLGSAPLVVIAADTASAAGLADMSAMAAGTPVLLLAPVRAAALLRRPVEPGQPAVALRAGGLFEPALLRGLADPTAKQILRDPPEIEPLPVLAHAALALGKLARLLPAMLAAPLRGAEAGHIAAARGLLSVEAEHVLTHPDREAARLVRVADAHVPLEDAPDARVIAFRAPDAGIEHLAILVGQPEHADAAGPAPLTRLHSECFTGDLLGSLRCDCGPQLRAALQRMGREGSGVLLYLAQEGRGIGLANKLRAYALQDRGLDTVDANRALGWNADERNFMVAATMLEQLGVRSVRLLTNNPDKIAALAACGIAVTGREPLIVAPNGVNDHYLATKARRFGHLME